MGSASTGQVIAEALGLALPGSALIPVPLTRHLRVARAAGKQILALIEQDLRPSKILTRAAFENAIVLHAAVGGSTNALLHLPAIAREVGIDITIDDFDRIHRRVPVLANAKTTGLYPVEYLWYAGGVPAVMLELKDLLTLDVPTVTGKTLGENLDQIEQSTFFWETRGFLRNVKVEVDEVLRSRAEPFGPEGGVAVLRGNLAPGGAVVKHFSVPKQMHVHVGPARVFDAEAHAVEALVNRAVQPGDVVVIRYEGPRANGMPEMYYATAIIAATAELSATTAVITDGRYSGAAKGPAVGHVTPEALDGGPLALVEEGDLIEIHVPERRLAIVGTSAGRLPPEQVNAVLEERRARWVRPKPRHERGILSLYARVAASPADGAYLA
jgi:dihydroxy-acid dehydratase